MEKKKPSIASIVKMCCLFMLFLIFILPIRGSSSTASKEKLNVLLIVIDALRCDHLSCYGYMRKTSPTLDKLAHEGVFFSNVISPSSQTGPVMASIFTGMYPYQHGVQFFSYNQSFYPFYKNASPHLSDKWMTLAEYFQAHGYTTLGIVSNPWLKKDFGYGQGFKEYKFIETWDGRFINQAFMESLQNIKESQPFFVYLHYMDVHAPYYNSHAFEGLYTPYKGDHIYGTGYTDILSRSDLEYSVALYDEEIHYADNLIMQIMNQLERTKILDNTLIIVTSDHGDEFYEHQGFGHGTTLYEELINTFFIFYNPNRFPAKKIHQKVSSVDFFPTILDIVDIPYRSINIEGKSLFSRHTGIQDFSRRKDMIFSELGDRKAVLYKEWKYIYDSFMKTEELYHIGTDKREKWNLVDKEIGWRKKLKAALLKKIEIEDMEGERTTPISEDTKAKLRSLGYISSSETTFSRDDASMRGPITPDINFKNPKHNPLQLVYGWKKQEVKEKDVFYLVGPKAVFILSNDAKKPAKELIIKGSVTLNDFPENTQKIKILCERRNLGEYLLDREGPFSLSFEIPPDFGKDRSLQFTMLSKNYSALNLNLKISSICLE